MDVDDVGAICMAHALADRGEAELLAMVQNSMPSLGIGAISVLNRYYGRDVPIGAYKGMGLSTSGPYLPYVSDLVSNWPSTLGNSSQVSRGVDVYRQVLAAQADRSVTISSIGLLTNLAELLRSTPDKHSQLNGRELVAQKVKLLAVMGGEYPSSDGLPKGCNFCGCAFGDKASSATAAAAANFVMAEMPEGVKIIFVGDSLGRAVISGGLLSACAPAGNPCRQAYLDYAGTAGKGRYSWDLLTTLASVRGAQAVGLEECSNCTGFNWVDPTNGANTWISRPSRAASSQTSKQVFLVLRDAQKAQDAIDSLLCDPPSKRKDHQANIIFS